LPDLNGSGAAAAVPSWCDWK